MQQDHENRPPLHTIFNISVARPSLKNHFTPFFNKCVPIAAKEGRNNYQEKLFLQHTYEATSNQLQ